MRGLCLPGCAVLTDNVPIALTFDDVLLVPRQSDTLPRTADVSTTLAGKALGIPILSSAMDTVTEAPMGIALARQGGMGIIHKNLSVAHQAEQVGLVKAVDGGKLLIGAAVGVGGDRDERITALIDNGVDLLVIDTAHGHSLGVLRACAEVKAKWPDITVIVGNVATGDAVRACVEYGADAVKVGVGPGSICTTRIVAGVGVPQLTAIAECSEAAHALGSTIIADGGIRSSGDVAKAIAAGADAVMIGSLFAGTKESPGEVEEDRGRLFKRYRGMGSLGAMKAGSRDRYFQDDDPGNPEASMPKLVPEGVAARVAYRGSVNDQIYQLVGGLRASMGYCGCPTIRDMQAHARFTRITSAGLAESHVHDVKITEPPPNYWR